ncbi:MAG TPA: nitroreductase family protein [Stenomitos sp.]
MTDKPANTQYPIHELLQKRWSPRAFSAQPISPQTLCSLLEAARWSASSFNEQPWFFIVATQSQPEPYQKLLACLAEANQAWANQAPVLMLSVAKLQFAHNNKENRHAFHDVGAAVASLSVQATAMGLFVHQMAGFDVNKAIEAFAIPATHTPVAAIAIGYPGNLLALPSDQRERELAPRTRKPLSEFVFSETWGNPSPDIFAN